jgi:phospholipase C
MRSNLDIIRFPRTALSLPIFAAVAPGAAYALPPFKHVVIVIQENRTPDNIFGSNPTFEPGVDIATSGTTSSGSTVTLTAETLNSCYDIDHSHAGFEDALNEGFDKDKASTSHSLCSIPKLDPEYKYVDNSNHITLSTGQTLTHVVQPYFDIAKNYGFANRMFQSNQGPSFPAHQFLFGGTSAPGADSDLFASENINGTKKNGGTGGAAGCAGAVFDMSTVNQINPYGVETGKSGYMPPPAVPPCFEHPVLADLLSNASADLTWRYYAENPNGIWTAPNAIEHLCSSIGTLPTSNGVTLCTSAPWTSDEVVTEYTGNSNYGTLLGTAQIFKDIEACNLPSVTWVTPTAEASDHSGITDGTGPQWVGDIVDAIGTQTCSNGETYWNDTAIIITWDDWGGWFDHVPPFKVNVLPPPPSPQSGVWGDGYTYGFRVPMLVVSAYTPAGFVGDTDSSGGTIVTTANHDFGTILYFVEQVFGLGFIGDLNPPGTYSEYADYAASRRGDLRAYFSLTSPRPFAPIKTQLGPEYFESLPASNSPVDNQ